MQCEAGENYSQEALDDMIKSWRDLGLSDSLLGGWGYVSVSPESSSFNNYWELSWSSKEEADAAWKEWILNEDAMAGERNHLQSFNVMVKIGMGMILFFHMTLMLLVKLLKTVLLLHHLVHAH